MLRKRIAALLMTLTLVTTTVAPAGALSAQSSGQPNGEQIEVYSVKKTLGNSLRGLFITAGMDNDQLGSDADCVALADSLGMLDKDDHTADEEVTQNVIDGYAASAGYVALKNALSAEKLQPLFVNGMAQPIFPYTTGAVEEDYDNADSDIIRFCVYVQTNYDTDGDGKLDLVKALVQLPRAAAEGDYKAATIYEARPYITGCTDMWGYEGDGEDIYDLTQMYSQPDPRAVTAEVETLAHAANADSGDWYYYNSYERMMDYEDLDWYDYYLVRGFAVVECGGLGTKGSEGFETCGTDLEIDAFKCVIEWLNGKEGRVAYTDLAGTNTIKADWSNGKVGMTGRSYAGTTQFGLATTGVEGLETIVPVAGIASWYEYTNSQGLATGGVAYSDALSSYCAGRKLDSEDWDTIKDTYNDYLGQIYLDQLALNGDYGDHWACRDYTVNADKIKCSALIVHGLNDENVRTKEFDLMYQAFKTAGKNVKLLLHQDAHLTPTYPSGKLVFDIGDSSYDELLNKWFSHYLYGVDNGAENMAAVTAQDSHNSLKWHYYDSWETAEYLTLDPDAAEDATTTISSNYESNGIEYNTWEQTVLAGSTGSSVLYTTDVEADTVIKGAVAVKFSAAVAMADDVEGDLADQDALMVSAMLVDVAPEGETFPAFNVSSSYVPKTTLIENGAWMGGGLTDFDLVKLDTSTVSYKVIGRGWMDLCNPGAGYTSASAARTGRVALDGSYHEYTLYLQPNLYTVEEGHTLALVLCVLDPDMSDYYSVKWNNGDNGWEQVVSVNPDFDNYTITLKDSTVNAVIPVEKDHTVTYSAEKGGEVTAGVASGEAVVSGTEVTLTAAANSGYRFSHWMVNGTKAEETGLTLTVTADKDLTIQAVFTKVSSGNSSSGSKPTTEEEKPAAPAFADVDESAYYAKAVAWAVENGITSGVAQGLFGPELSCTRAQVMTFLWRAAGSPEPENMGSFGDVDENAYYAKAVAWAVENGITSGMDEGYFGVDEVCTRAQIVTFLYRYSKGAAGGQSSFGDVAADAYYAQAVAWAAANGVTGGTSAATFSPDQFCTRGQIVTMLWALLNK